MCIHATYLRTIHMNVSYLCTICLLNGDKMHSYGLCISALHECTLYAYQDMYWLAHFKAHGPVHFVRVESWPHSTLCVILVESGSHLFPLNDVYSRLVPPFSIYFDLFPPIPTYFHLFTPIHTYARLFLPSPVYSRLNQPSPGKSGQIQLCSF
jgi:hypothetical protein